MHPTKTTIFNDRVKKTPFQENPIKRYWSIFILLIFVFQSGHVVGQPYEIFESDEVIEFTLKCDMKALQKDRGDDTQYHEAILQYKTDQTAFEIPVRLKSRGNFRKDDSNCKYPPLFVNFKKSETPKESIFKDQDKTKLVTPCQGDKYIINEYLVYKLYNLITPKSFDARLVKVVYHDNVKNKSSDAYFGMLIEEEKQMAKKNNAESVELKGLKPNETNKDFFLKMAVFQYLIGNTDWSIQYLQNIKLLSEDSQKPPLTVPYDFDHAGIVRAPYAHPAEELRLSSTQHRLYRGYCMKNMDEFSEVFAMFNNLKDQFYAVYNDCELISDGYRKTTLKFLDKFYETINDPKKASAAFMYPCDKSGTGNIVIKGLNKD